MRYREFGQSGKQCSVIGFGGMRFPSDDDECINMVHRAIELGINYFDTAPMYCDDRSEELIGRGIDGFQDRVYVSTKSSIGMDPGADDVRRRIDTQLQRLRVDRITFYHMWCMMDYGQFEQVIAPGGPFEGARKAQDQGLIEHILFSMHANGEEIAKMVETGLFEGITAGYNVINHTNRYTGINAAYRAGMGVVIMNPLGGGLIAKAPDQFRYLTSTPDEEPVQMALKFLLYHPEINVVLCGMGNVEQIEYNAAVADLVPEPDSEITRTLKSRIASHGENYCTLCKYCLPCPEGIQIPYYVFALDRHNLNDVKGAKGWLDLLKKHDVLGDTSPGDCTECGECLEKCTQKLPIIEKLKQASDLFFRE